MTRPRPFHEWHEDIGDVLWWLWPIESAPYCGSPTCLGYTVMLDCGVSSSQQTFEPFVLERRFQIGGWPFSAAQESHLFWTPLPSNDEIAAYDRAIRDHIRGGPDPFAEPETNTEKFDLRGAVVTPDLASALVRVASRSIDGSSNA